ncbi:caleosin family protein [Aspergillus ibericus CBS 121593]|uniref:Caleosin domain protein n=1 Tax=Aspergillus ibericus CBS 121593 TaxID=1448316 RepID=A0A395GK88_9EURO|nr:caleosin domain protein [Aspergillus ibericus CBS 121593]RAK95824.1 caleosin domain protein [Aspergillus ibericus CBS 121593]
MPRKVSFSEAQSPNHEKPIRPPSISMGFPTSAPKCPATDSRPPARYTNDYIEKPGVPRGNAAASIDRPDGDEDYAKRYGDFTPLQQHILFWDRDSDGQIYPWDTYKGFRDLGFNVLFSLLAVLIINLNFSYPTRLAHSYLPDPWFRVYVDGIHKAKHGSDSNTYDPEGRFVPQSFENMFAKYDHDGDGALSLRQLFEMMHGNRCAADPFGWGAAIFEWGTTWLLIQKDGKVWKEDVRGVFDGSLFWKIREARQSPRGWSQGLSLGGSIREAFRGFLDTYLDK